MYGITIEEYESMRAIQNYSCAICFTPEAETTHGRLDVDHDHETGQVRGLLCGKCNKALGLMRDDAGLLRAAADYLEDR